MSCEMQIADAIKAMRRPGIKAWGYVLMTSEDGTYIQLVKKDAMVWLKNSYAIDPDMILTAWIEDNNIFFN